MLIDGDVIQPLSLDRIAIRQLPDEFHVEDVGAFLPGMTARAVKVRGLLEIPAIRLGADHVTFHSHDGAYAATLTLEQARDFGLLLYEVEGGPVPLERGGPFRLITPGLDDLCAHVKGVGRIEIRSGSGKDSRPSEMERRKC